MQSICISPQSLARFRQLRSRLFSVPTYNSTALELFTTTGSAEKTELPCDRNSRFGILYDRTDKTLMYAVMFDFSLVCFAFGSTCGMFLFAPLCTQHTDAQADAMPVSRRCMFAVQVAPSASKSRTTRARANKRGANARKKG